MAVDILEYWRMIELLEQMSYEESTGRTKLSKSLEQHKQNKENVDKTKKPANQLTGYRPWEKEQTIRQILQSEASECEMPLWDNSTVYIGRVKRQACIAEIAKALGKNLSRQIEDNRDDIAVLCFQCSEEGNYVKNTISLSPVLWALKTIHDNPKKPLRELLSQQIYQAEISTLEERLFFNIEEREDTGINSDRISEIQTELEKEYSELLHSFGDKAITWDTGIKFHLFKDEKTKEKYSDCMPERLDMDFFSNDLEMVKRKIKQAEQCGENSILNDLVEYICAPYYRNQFRKRYDLVKPENQEKFTSQLLDILRVDRYPAGKWPSQYMPAMMQQVAINLAISRKTGGLTDDVGRIFSVNGPPGTGKTTLLKEIIAENVVQKANVLSQYDSPDDLFEAHPFKQGLLNGAYSQYTRSWYSMKDDAVNDYSILVVSSNNAAVENITKELPISQGLHSQLSSSTKDAEHRQQLNEVDALFCAQAQSSDDSSDSAEGIYFTKYARKFFGDEDKEADAWGLVTAPLGKRQNIGKFYSRALFGIIGDNIGVKKELPERIEAYHQVRKEFLEQSGRVEALRAELERYAEKSQRAYDVKRKLDVLQKQYHERKEKHDAALHDLESQILQRQSDMLDAGKQQLRTRRAVLDAENIISQFKTKVETKTNEKTGYMRDVQQADADITLWNKIFHHKKYRSAQEQKEISSDRINELTQTLEQMESVLNTAEMALEQAKKLDQNVIGQIESHQQALEDLHRQKVDIERVWEELRRQSVTEQEKAVRTKAEYAEMKQQLHEASVTEACVCLDQELVENMLSDDAELSTQAQILNPWLTQRYNREREKLFGLALCLTEKFILASNRCITNLKILGQYWGMRTEKDAPRIVFGEDDRKNAVPALYQTLFLLVPVISSTFASVGRFLQDTAIEGVIGTLMIDEAGQAAPQKAVGSIYRARNVIVVGDPKQVEPVVTDDLDMFKEAYIEQNYEMYRSKSLSVQNCADIINPFGTFFRNAEGDREWVGCPLVVHRRCLSPMYNISNQISYDGIMKQQTLPASDEKVRGFLRPSSEWMNVSGSTTEPRNYYVPAQGAVVCELLEKAFSRTDMPDLYIISPYKTVIAGIKKELKEYAESNVTSVLHENEHLQTWLDDNVGTVHKFQGKEADEVIFLLGCDKKYQNSYVVTGFVNSNIVNVAITRAKYRLYVVGDIDVWKNNSHVCTAKREIEKANTGIYKK